MIESAGILYPLFKPAAKQIDCETAAWNAFRELFRAARCAVWPFLEKLL